jgi:hypothetical protein
LVAGGGWLGGELQPVDIAAVDRSTGAGQPLLPR